MREREKEKKRYDRGRSERDREKESVEKEKEVIRRKGKRGNTEELGWKEDESRGKRGSVGSHGNQRPRQVFQE